MIRLTKEEKAARYDALQSAIQHTIESYQRRRKDMDKRFSDAQEVGVLGAYSKGYADACGMIVDDMGRWVE